SAYFSLIGGTQELFLEHGRARGTFKDPNVFGPFLVPPLVYGFLRHLTGEDRLGLQSAILAFLGLGILLSFSRGAWASTIFSVGISTYLLFISARSNSLRLKVVGLAICTVVIAAALLVFALSFDAIANLMSVRGQFVQSYDTLERFAGARIAIDVILTHPLGIGAYSFAEFHEAEPHNAYLYSFLIGGWLGGFAFIALIVSTIIVAFRNTLVASPVRLFAIVLFSTFLAVSLQSLVVDTDHWRQLYILAGCIWGIHAWLHKPERGHETETAEKKMNALEPPLFPTLNQRFARLNQKARDTAANNNARTPRRTKWRRKLGGTHRPRNLARVTRIAAAKSERAAADPPAAPTQSNRVPSSGQPERADVSPHMQNRILRARYRDTVQAKPVSEPDVSEQTSPAVSRVIKDNDTALASSPREAFGIRASDNLAPRAEFGRRKT
ncbi:MAG: O-antigen ligase family protein, partial [Pseudomonadota bacterium]